jgi:predicted dehydrogenase
LSADIYGTQRGAFPACLDDFVRAIRLDQPTAAGVRDGRRVTAVLCAIHESLETGGAVSVRPLADATKIP